MMRIIASHAVLMWTMFFLHPFAIGQAIMAPSPYSGVFILPPMTEPNLTAIEKLLSDGDEQALQGWARTNHYLYLSLGDRQVAFFHPEIAQPKRAGWQALLDILSSDHPFLLTPNNDSQGASLLKVLSRPSPRAVFPRLAEIATEHVVAIQRYLQCVAEVQIDNQTLRIVLDEPNRSFDWDALPKTPSERPMAQERCDSETHTDWRVVALGPLVDDKERARLTAKAFDRLADEIGNEQKLIDHLLQNWMETLASEFPDVRPLSWQAWDQLSLSLQQTLRSALLGMHLDETRVIDSSIIESGILQKADVRLKMIGGLQLAVLKQGGERYLYQIPFDGSTVTVYTPEALKRQQP